MDSDAREIEEFLARQPSWLRRILLGESVELSDFVSENWPEMIGAARDQYEELLKTHPDKLREYRDLQKRLAAESAVAFISALKPGARRLDSFALEAKELEANGLTQADIAATLNERYPDRRDRKGNQKPFTEEGVRKLLGRRRTGPPDKT
jgi:hypothetical protein